MSSRRVPAEEALSLFFNSDANSDTLESYLEEHLRKMRCVVVLEMSEGLQAHNIPYDNFFTSYHLGEEQKRKLTIVGKVKRNKAEHLSEIPKMQERPLHSSIFVFTEKAAVISYCPKRNKNVLVMSTMHTDASMSTRNDMKPQMMLDYLPMSSGLKSTSNRMLEKCIDVGKALITPKIQRSARAARSTAGAAAIEKIKFRQSNQSAMDPDTGVKKQKRCQVCLIREDSETSTSCVKCKNYICRKHTVTFSPPCGEHCKW